MLNSTAFNCTSPAQGTSSKFHALCYKTLMGFVILFTLFLSNSAIAQTIRQSQLNCDISNRNPCTSKDLSIVSVFIDAPTCVTCTGTDPVTYPLLMTINNGTKSERTSFSLYGTLSAGAYITSGGVNYSGNIFICVGPITVKSDETLPGETAPGNQTFAVGSITFTCGQNLTLTDNFLAWTDASGETISRCLEYAQATRCADIAPKCGFAPSITIQGPVPAPTLDKVDPTCTVSTGKITVTSSTTGLLFSLDGAAFAAYPTGGWTVNSGQHCVVAKRTSDACTSNQTCITIGNVPANPDRPVVTLQDATICGTVTTPTITVQCPIAGTYSLTQNGTTTSKTYPTVNPVVFNVQPGLGFSITVTNTAGCTSTATTCTNYTTNSCPASNVTKADVQTVELEAPKTNVLAAPNPFTNRVRFTLTSAVSGMGSLEIFNTMGQKIATVYQGYVEAGRPMNKEYVAQRALRANLIYVFRVGDQKTTGKLLNW